jgi:hypothetical protein
LDVVADQTGAAKTAQAPTGLRKTRRLAMRRLTITACPCPVSLDANAPPDLLEQNGDANGPRHAQMYAVVNARIVVH